ncbi:SDR family NAD(P)-dependent oxidoreductase [Mucilaginibacter sp. Bleaf8]|uniref:oxidoreductase n=1 Tax=Mucilaginibacter sp. Bleaf8 TaxID=2834430 RepID=UPI001BD07E9D|nr:oxidoreductase [Mucilaginibacter sp. Bleaf8]MBS7565607.1 SDR family NAD(P)-dependent oxidoreductase [Mucilaginibacter sp. Bleaf8]
MTKVWFITGSSRGLGLSVTKAALKASYQVAATARKPEQLKQLIDTYGTQILPVQLDVTDKEQIRQAVEQTIKHFGRIDVLVNNAGFGITGAAEAFTDEQVRSQLETNLYGPIEITRAVLPHMRRQRAGRILQISSIGGRIGTPGVTIYQAAKFGLSGFSEALAPEVLPLGIHVTSVEPGGFRTDWAGASMSYAPLIEGYESTVGFVTEFLKGDKFIPMGDPDKAAQVLINLAEHPEPPLHLVLGSEASAMLQQIDAKRKAEFEKWLPVTQSTDADDAADFLQTDAGRAYSKIKGIE